VELVLFLLRAIMLGKNSSSMTAVKIDPYQVGLAGLLSGTAELAPVARQAFIERD
jgi:hypothetical protein